MRDVLRVDVGSVGGEVTLWTRVVIDVDGSLSVRTITPCAPAVGASATMTETEVIVSAYYRRPALGVRCPPFVGVQRIELPEPIGERAVVDATFDRQLSQVIRWRVAGPIGDGMTVRLRYRSRAKFGCGSKLVETPTSVVITLFESKGDAPNGKLYASRHDVQLATALNGRTILSGESAYS
jgi:hypothetical protein